MSLSASADNLSADNQVCTSAVHKIGLKGVEDQNVAKSYLE